jgi:hypothetical protein
MNDIENIINNKSEYIADGMESFKIDDTEYSGYSKYVFVWERSYVTSPTRAKNGSLGELDEQAAFNTPRLKVTYDLMPIDTYRKFKKQYLSKNEFNVTCYDTDFDEIITKKMYIAEPSEPEYLIREYNKKLIIVGMKNYSIEVIGTNND